MSTFNSKLEQTFTSHLGILDNIRQQEFIQRRRRAFSEVLPLTSLQTEIDRQTVIATQLHEVLHLLILTLS
jgi:hypothetical protein